MRKVEEVLAAGDIPLWRHPEWAERFPWLVQGTTGGRSESGETLDFGFFGAAPVGEVTSRWRRLRSSAGMPTTLHARQVHGADVGEWLQPLAPGMVLVEGLDAHVTVVPGLLLAVSVADCVPISIVAERSRAVAMVHAGWRGIAAGVLETAVERVRAAGGRPDELWLHCGPSICGDCYEVGPEVHEAIDPTTPVPTRPTPIDLAAAIARRAAGLGLDRAKVTASAHCTRCGQGGFFSHRGGSPARQIGVVGIRP